jgi:hypothetical protein
MRTQNNQEMEEIASPEAEPMRGTSDVFKSREPQNAELQKVEPAEEERAAVDGPESKKGNSAASADSVHGESSEPASAGEKENTRDLHVNNSEASGPDLLEKEEQTLTKNDAIRQDGVIEVDQSAEHAAIKADGTSVSGKGLQGPGGLAQELLAFEQSNLPAAGSHRERFKRTSVGQKGKDVRLKMAVAKGSLERGALIAERRGTGLTEVSNSNEPRCNSTHKCSSLKTSNSFPPVPQKAVSVLRTCWTLFTVLGQVSTWTVPYVVAQG